MISQLKISQKVYFLGFCQLVLTVFIGWVGYNQMDKIGTEIVDITEKDIPLTNALTKLTEHQLHQAIIFERAVLKGILANQNYPKAQEKFDKLQKEVKKVTKKITAEIKDVEVFLEEIIPKTHSVLAVEEFEKILAELKLLEIEYGLLEKQVFDVLNMVASGNTNDALEQVFKVEMLEDKIDTKLVACSPERNI